MLTWSRVHAVLQIREGGERRERQGQGSGGASATRGGSEAWIPSKRGLWAWVVIAWCS